LHDIAIDAILCKRAHWFQTLKLTLADLPYDNFKFVPLSIEPCIPRSLTLSNTGSVANQPELKTFPASAPEEIAVVGMACRFSDADSLEELWEVISTGTSTVSKMPDERFNSATIAREPNMPNYWGHFLRRPGSFDHRFFGSSGREAKSMDPQQRLALEVAYEALESSGYCSQAETDREGDFGCYLGVVGADYEENVGCENANAFSATGTLRAFISGRISHHFGWSGPSIVLDTACSSSAVAIHTACKVRQMLQSIF